MRKMYARARGSRRAWFGALGVVMVLGALDHPALAEPAGDDMSPKPVPGGAPPAIDDPVPPGFASWDEVWAVQEDLNETADRIVLAAETQDTAAGGLGAIEADTQDREVRVHWKGRVPATVHDVIDRSTADVAVLRADHTAEELEAAADRILAEQPVPEAGATPLVVSVGPRGDASGLEVTVTSPAETARELPFLRDAAVDVTVRQGEPPTPASRDNDRSPYWAGGRWMRIDGLKAKACTTGFAITRGDQESLLTAAHCATNGDRAYDGGGFSATDKIGPVQFSRLPGTKKGGYWLGMDVEEIKTSSDPRMFDGSITTSTTDSVVGAQNNYEDNLVCTSGSFSGTRCDLLVEDTGLTLYIQNHTDGLPMYGSHMVRAVHLYGGNAGGNGDSGGPVFAFAKDHETKAWARGTISLRGIDPVPCTGVPAGNGRQCSDEVWYVDLNWSLPAGAQLQTTWP